MSLRVGVVCEGSHDFLVVSQFISKIIREFGETVESIKCLQPEISAAFLQTTAGGWAQVKSWCEAQEGKGYRKFIDKPLFATSTHYDLLIVHLDGDVVEHCEIPPLEGLAIEGMRVVDVVEALKQAILSSWLDLDPAHDGRVVACIPVRHLEAWLSAAVGPAMPSHELIDTKLPFRGGLAFDRRGTMRQSYTKAASDASLRLPTIRAACESFRLFEQDLRAATEAA